MAGVGLLSPLLGKLTKLMEEKYAQIKGVRKKVKSLQKELVSINVALEKHAEMERPDKQVKLWMNELREMAYDMEDCVDDFMYHVGVHHEPAGIKQFLQEQFHKLKTLSYRSKFAKQIQELKAEVNEAYARYKQYKIDGSESSAMIDPRLSELHVEMEKLVGIEGPIKEIINRFNVKKTGPTNQRRVISIVGLGGSGKTTLAYQVYKRIKGQFSCACFVSLSQKPNMRTILNELLSKAGSSGSTSDSVQHLIERLRALLENEKYLIVIDDIWGTSDWNSIKSAIPENVHASRIITTTRNKNIAEICCTSKEDFVYPMKLLSQSDSRKLFLKRTFDAEDECPGQLEGIINEVLRKCGGLPLAIVTLASLFATKQGTEEEWIRVLKSIRSIEGKDEKLEVMDWILALSYNDLPYHLKICLLSLSMFPEDCEIDKYSLVWRWIAEGFVVSMGDCTFQEEVGERYFNELINRSLIQPISHTIFGEVSACRVHDIVLDFIVSRSTEENFVNSILDGQYTPSQHDKIRRLYIRNSNGLALEISQQNVDLSHLRALNVFSAVTWMPPLSAKEFLRVLDLEGCHTLKDDDLKNIRSLIQLRYLGLRDTEIKNLPIQFNKLRFLQTLDIRGTEIRKLPQAIVELKGLVRLVGDELTLPDGFGKMEALEELGKIDVDSITVNFSKDLGDLTRLRKLDFVSSHALPQDTIVKPFMSPNSIRSLEIEGVHGDAEFFMDPWYSPPRLLQKFVQSWHSKPVRFSFYRFPKWINSSLCNLTYLRLAVEHMHSTDMHMLQSLPALCWLMLSVHYISEEAGLSVSHDGFQQLTHLWFNYEYGTGLTFEAGAMRKLQRLFFTFDMAEAKRTYGGVGPFCFGIQHLISLNYIDVVVYDRGLADDAESSEIWQVVDNISNEIKLHPLPQNPKFEMRLELPSKHTGCFIPTQNLECTSSSSKGNDE